MSEAYTKPMSKGDRDELAVVVRMRAKVAREEIETRRATVVADAEAQLATIFKAQDERWKAALDRAKATVDEVNSIIKAELTAAGVPENFHASVGLSFFSRGENFDAGRRAELRRVVATRADADAKKAKDTINRWEVDARADLASRALDSAEARAWLDNLPGVAALMPAVDAAALTVGPTPKRALTPGERYVQEVEDARRAAGGGDA